MAEMPESTYDCVLTSILDGTLFTIINYEMLMLTKPEYKLVFAFCTD